MKFKSSARNITATLIVSVVIILTIYWKSFDDIERICDHKKDTEYFLLNYVSKQNLKKHVTNHNKEYILKNEYVARVYLLNPVFRIPDPIFESTIDYNQTNCKEIDNMDFYCIVHYRKKENGVVDIWYNFME